MYGQGILPTALRGVTILLLSVSRLQNNDTMFVLAGCVGGDGANGQDDGADSGEGDNGSRRGDGNGGDSGGNGGGPDY